VGGSGLHISLLCQPPDPLRYTRVRGQGEVFLACHLTARRDSPSGAIRKLWVFLPLLGLKHARRHDIHSNQHHHDFMNTVQKERLAVQSWGLVADAIRLFASDGTSAPFVGIRIIGLVGNHLDCDPWLDIQASRSYECLALPPV